MDPGAVRLQQAARAAGQHPQPGGAGGLGSAEGAAGAVGEGEEGVPSPTRRVAGGPRHVSPVLQPCPAPQDFLTRHANKKGSWIGLRDLNIEGEFVWMDQNPLDYR